MRHALVIGARGALGQAVVEAYQQSGKWSVSAVDVVPLSSQKLADSVKYLQLPSPEMSIAATQEELLRFTAQVKELHAVVNVGGGWAGGTVRDSSTASAAELMLRQSLFTSFAAAHVFARCGAPNGLLAFTGANAALHPTPGMLGYGVAKAAVHFLCQSVAADVSQLPPGAKVLALLPITLDTPGNRAAMPQADTSGWTPLEAVATKILQWSDAGTSTPQSGSLVEVKTVSSKTTFNVVQ